jgi:hypothetical protein
MVRVVLQMTFQMWNTGKVINYGYIISANRRETGKLCIPVLSLLLADESQYNKWRQKAVQQVYVVFEGQNIQPPATTVGQGESERSIFVLCILYQHYQ